MRVAPLVLALSVFANDTAMGGQGASLVPLQTSAVFMQSEDITLTLTGMEGDPALASGEAREREKWHVEANYVFTNPSKRTVKLQLGFPEYRCETRDEESREFCPGDSLFQFEDMPNGAGSKSSRRRRSNANAQLLRLPKRYHPPVARLAPGAHCKNAGTRQALERCSRCSGRDAQARGSSPHIAIPSGNAPAVRLQAMIRPGCS